MSLIHTKRFLASFVNEINNVEKVSTYVYKADNALISRLTPASKAHLDKALSYINEYYTLSKTLSTNDKKEYPAPIVADDIFDYLKTYWDDAVKNSNAAVVLELDYFIRSGEKLFKEDYGFLSRHISSKGLAVLKKMLDLLKGIKKELRAAKGK